MYIDLLLGRKTRIAWFAMLLLVTLAPAIAASCVSTCDQYGCVTVCL